MPTISSIAASSPLPSSPHATSTMKANRRRDTKPELRLRSLLHKQGLRYRVDKRVVVSDVPCRPDILFGKAKVAVFVDGCFWHACPKHGELPQSNREFWKEKLRRNRERDLRQTAALERAGWRVIRIWEHEDPAEAQVKVVAAVRGDTATKH